MNNSSEKDLNHLDIKRLRVESTDFLDVLINFAVNHSNKAYTIYVSIGKPINTQIPE